MDQQTYESLKTLLDYLREDEAKHFEGSEKPKVHIFRDIERLDGWVAEFAKDYPNEKKCPIASQIFNPKHPNCSCFFGGTFGTHEPVCSLTPKERRQERRLFKINGILKEAYQAGADDTTTDDVLTEAALAYIDSEITDRISQKERDRILEAYCGGFMGKPIKTFLLGTDQ